MQSDAGEKHTKDETLDRAVCQRQLHGRQIDQENELHRHCEEVYVDLKKTIEEQEKRIMKYKSEGDRHFTESRREPRPKKVKGPEDSIVSGMIKQPSQDFFFETT